MDWRKSSYSSNGGADCVEAATASGFILVRDTTHRDGVTLTILAAAWQPFADSLK